MKFRLLSAHYLQGDIYAPGDKELSTVFGDESGSLIEDGAVKIMESPGQRRSFSIDMKVFKPTLEMVALDDEAKEALDEEYERLQKNQQREQGVAIVPIDQLPQFMDNYESTYTPGGFVKGKTKNLTGAEK